MFPNSTDANEKPTHQITQIVGTIRLRTESCTPIRAPPMALVASRVGEFGKPT
jgi:hypothetical protein